MAKSSSKWVEFVEKFAYTHESRATTVYPKGGKFRVKNEIAEKAIGKGAAKPCVNPNTEKASSEEVFINDENTA